MGGETARRVEAAVSVAASAALGGAMGFAAFSIVGLIAVAVAAAIAGLAAGWGVLARLGREPDFPVPMFDLGAVHVVPVDEEPLELDDVLAEVGPGARVVRLFDVNAMPTPAELRQRIDRHLGREAPPVASPDASQALIEALTQLRQSLR